MYIRNLFQNKAHKEKRASMQYHTHIDAIGSISVDAVKALTDSGFEIYNFDIKNTPIISDLKITTGKDREKEEYMFVLNYKTLNLDDALDMAKHAKIVMNQHNIRGYIEVEEVYSLPIKNKLFQPDKFNKYFSQDGQHATNTLPFKAYKAPLKSKLIKPTQSNQSFSVGEIHLTVPRSIDGRIATNPDLINSLMDIGFYGPDIEKYIKREHGKIAKNHQSNEPTTLIDVPLTISSANLKELAFISNLTIDMINDIGWSDNTKITEKYPLSLKFEVMKEHHWVNIKDPEHIYRDVLYSTMFDTTYTHNEYEGQIAGYKLSSAELLL